MFNLMDYKQGEEIKERLDRLEKKVDDLLRPFAILIENSKKGDTIPHSVAKPPKKKGK